MAIKKLLAFLLVVTIGLPVFLIMALVAGVAWALRELFGD